MPSPTDFIAHIPVFVWALLAFIVLSGVRLSRPTSMPAWRLILIPLLWLALGAWGLDRHFGWLTMTALAWVAGLAGGVALVRASRWPGGARFDAANQRFLVPGSWLPLALMVGIFASKFALGVGLALHPEWAVRPGLPVAMLHLGFGLCSGALIGRSLNVLRLRPSNPMAVA